MKPDFTILAVVVGFLLTLGARNLYLTLGFIEVIALSIAISGLLFFVGAVFWNYFSKPARERKKRIEQIVALPSYFKAPQPSSIELGFESDLKLPIYLPDSIRTRHVHILGATGSGKTESVILNFLRQDVSRGLGAIILDAKGDHSFLDSLNNWIPKESLQVFDLASPDSLTYNPLEVGHPFEAAQRLFASLTWSEEYYKSKAFSALQRLFQAHHERQGRNPTLHKLSELLNEKETFSAFVNSKTYSSKIAEADFSDLGGLRDKVKSLCTGHLEKILSPPEASQMTLASASEGKVLYFMLQSLLSPELVTIIGRLLINHLNYLAGTAHRSGDKTKKRALVPTYFDEFASFACPEFADLISKARSANFALHFSHQSVGDLTEVSPGFLNRITDNSATKIVMRINDPDTAEFFSRTFGTRLYQKVTQKITNVKEIDLAQVAGDGTQREAHQFRASPDLLKTLPTGFGSVLVAHGEDTPQGASCVFKIKFPKL